MDDLVEWLRVHLDEDERLAKHAAPGPWRAEKGGPQDGPWPRDWVNVGVRRFKTPSEQTAEHIARWDPACVLREVEAKRLRVAAIERALADDPEDETAQWAMRVEALPYADRPGYLAEWRP